MRHAQKPDAHLIKTDLHRGRGINSSPAQNALEVFMLTMKHLLFRVRMANTGKILGFVTCHGVIYGFKPQICSELNNMETSFQFGTFNGSSGLFT